MTIPDTMTAVVLTGYGGLEKLEYREDVATPQPGAGEVLMRITAAGMNNTDINTRVGWYNPSVDSGTTSDGGQDGFGVASGGMGDWTGDVVFPRIQGADAVGYIVEVGSGVDRGRIGERVVCNPYFHDADDEVGLDTAGFLGSERDGCFAQFMTMPCENTHAIADSVTIADEAIATLPCSGGTAMNMLLMAKVMPGDRMLVTGASGGVGSLLVQIGKHLGADVVAVCSVSKQQAVLDLGADAAIDRDPETLVEAALAAGQGGSFTVVADVVGGDSFADYLALLARGGRYVTAGAIAGPMVTLDLRTLYLKSLEFYGSAAFRRDTFATLMGILAEGGLRPAVAAVRPLSEIREAQTAFLDKTHVGSMVLVPPPIAGDQP